VNDPCCQLGSCGSPCGPPGNSSALPRSIPDGRVIRRWTLWDDFRTLRYLRVGPDWSAKEGRRRLPQAPPRPFEAALRRQGFVVLGNIPDRAIQQHPAKGTGQRALAACPRSFVRPLVSCCSSMPVEVRYRDPILKPQPRYASSKTPDVRRTSAKAPIPNPTNGPRRVSASIASRPSAKPPTKSKKPIVP
jgi:hypothetical protein